MILKNADKKKLRKILEIETKKVPNRERIHIDKEILEQLIFIKDFGYDDSGNKITFKYPAWTGPFLKKIDLSEVSFDEVIWDYRIIENLFTNEQHSEHKFKVINQNYANQKIENTEKKVLICSLCKTINKTDLSIDLSDTNAKIDFSKAITLKSKENCLYNCNFDNVDLSESHLEECHIIRYCSFINTNITSKNINTNNLYIECDFTNCNFQDLTMTMENFALSFKNCNMSNSRLHIKGNINKMKKNMAPCETKVPPIALEIALAIRLHHLDNCFVSGIKIRSKEEKNEIKKQAAKDYNKHVEQALKQIEEEIKEKVKTKNLA